VGGFISHDENGQGQIIGYFSKKLNKTESHWTTIEKECYAIVCLFRHFQYILEGYNVRIHTDNKSLIYLPKYATATSKATKMAYVSQ